MGYCKTTSNNKVGATLATYAYDLNGNQNSLTYANGITTTYSYNNANLITNLSNKKGTAVLSNYAYTYYLDGNQATKTDNTGRVTAYIYDGLNQITEEKETFTGRTLTKNYIYDTAGNRASMAVAGADNYKTTYTYDANNRLLKEAKLIGTLTDTTTYTYDANGNQLSIQKGSGVEQYVFDVFNRVASATVNGIKTNYAYKAGGLRISKTVNGAKTTQVWDGTDIVLEFNASNVVTGRYIRGLNLVKSDTNGYYLFNAHGDVTQLTDAVGVVTKNYLYDSFGIETGIVATDTNPFRYCGEYFDKETGKVYLRARYYNPATSRMLSEDTYWNVNNMIFVDSWNTKIPRISLSAIRQSSNLYVYAMSNPVMYGDWTGFRTYVINGINNGSSGFPATLNPFIQALTYAGIQDVRRAPAYTETNVITGAGEAIAETFNMGKYTDDLTATILQDLRDSLLTDGEELNLIGYSGGGIIAINVARKLDSKATVNNIILIGAPVNKAKNNNTGQITDIWSKNDPLSKKFVWWNNVEKVEMTQGPGHTDYFKNGDGSKGQGSVNYIKTLIEIIKERIK